MIFIFFAILCLNVILLNICTDVFEFTTNKTKHFCLVCTMKMSVLLPTPPSRPQSVSLTHLNSHCQALSLTFHNKAALRSFRNICHKRKTVSTHTSDAGKRDYSHVQLAKTSDSQMKHHMNNMEYVVFDFCSL